jgi:hypothetical protein
MLRHRGIGAVVIVLGVLVLGLGLAGRAAAVPVGPPKPSIDDILGVWKTTWQERNFDLVTGEKSHHTTEGTLTITKIDYETVNLHCEADYGGVWDEVTHYAAGLVVAGGSDDDVLGSWADTWYAEVHGRAPKLHMDGPYMGYDLNQGWFEVGTISAKHISSL